MKIKIQTFIANEENIIEFFLRYYSSLLSNFDMGVIQIIDNGSTDQTKSIIKSFTPPNNVSIDLIDVVTSEYREDIVLLFKNEFWRWDKTKPVEFDYIFIVDCDEIIYDRDLIDNLRKGYTFFISDGKNVLLQNLNNISELNFNNTENYIKATTITLQQYCKINIFNPVDFSPNYLYGCHNNKAICVKSGTYTATFLYHIRYTDYNSFYKKMTYNISRTKNFSRSNGISLHWREDRNISKNRWDRWVNNNYTQFNYNKPTLHSLALKNITFKDELLS